MDNRLPEGRDKKRIFRKDQLLDVATHLFSRYGLEGTTTKDIAREAGVSSGLLYHYYKSKEELLLDVVMRFVTISEDLNLDKVDCQGPIEEVLPRILHMMADFFEKHHDEMLLIFKAGTQFPAIGQALRSMKNRSRSLFIELLRDRAAKGEIVECDFERVAGAMGNFVALEHILEVPNRNDIDSIADLVLLGLKKR